MTKFVRPTAPAKKTIAKPAKITPTTKIEVEADTTEQFSDEELHTAWADINARLRGMLDRLGKPSWVRQLVNATIGVVTYASAWYGCMALLDTLMMGVVAYTGIGFISFLIAFLGCLAAFMASWKIAGIAYRAAESFSYDSVKNRVTSWFSFGKTSAA